MNRRDFIKGVIATGAFSAICPENLLQKTAPKAISFDGIIATTLKAYEPVLRDNMFKQQIIWYANLTITNRARQGRLLNVGL